MTVARQSQLSGIPLKYRSNRLHPSRILLLLGCIQTVLVGTGIAILASDSINSRTTLFLALALTWSFTVTLFILIKRGWFASAIFILLVIQPIFSVYLNQILGDKEPLWKLIFVNSMMVEPICLLIVHSLWLTCLLTFAMALTPPINTNAYAPPHISPIGIAVCWIVFASASMLTLGTALTTNRDSFVIDVQGGDRLMMVLGPLLIGLGAGLGLVFRNWAMKALAILCLISAFAIALSGYRSVFVFAASAFAATLFARRRISTSTILISGAGAWLAYQIMSYLAFLRAKGATLIDVMSGTAPAVTFADLSKTSGKAEQIAVYTAYWANTSDHYYGLTYLYGLYRTLPNSIYVKIGILPRIQDILVDSGPIAFKQSGINLGAYYFAESLLNFGTFFAGLVTISTVLLLTLIERSRLKTSLNQMIYPGFVMLMPVLALYGSANFIKQLLTIIFICLIIYIVGVQRISVTKKAR